MSTLRRRPTKPADEAAAVEAPPATAADKASPRQVSTAPERAAALERASAVDADSRARAAGLVVTAPNQRTAPFAGPIPHQGAGFQRITERIFDLPNSNDEYSLLEAALSLGTQDFDSVAQALDRAEDHARRAHRLYVAARLDYERFLADAEVIEAAIRTEAASELQAEKDSGSRTKQITDADVRAKSAALFPDEWRDLAEKKVQAKLAVEHLERFADLWVSRCRSLGGLLASKR